AYRDSATGVEFEVFVGPDWMDSAQYDVQAKADCSGGIVSRDQQALMVQSILEARFQLKAHKETRELPVYNLVVGKDGPKLKASADQTPTPFASGPPTPCDPDAEKFNLPPLPPPPRGGGRGGLPDLSNMPRGAMFMMMSPTGMTMV